MGGFVRCRDSKSILNLKSRETSVPKANYHRRNGKILVDYIGRFENLSRDFASVCDKLNVSAELPRINTTVHEDYRTYYSDSSRERVAEHWGEDIARFFYNFENQNLSPISITSTADCL